MSNFRWSIGLGPIRYNAPIGGKSKSRSKGQTEKKPMGCLGLTITFVVVVVGFWLCCGGFMALAD